MRKFWILGIVFLFPLFLRHPVFFKSLPFTVRVLAGGAQLVLDEGLLVTESVLEPLHHRAQVLSTHLALTGGGGAGSGLVGTVGVILLARVQVITLLDHVFEPPPPSHINSI